MTPPNQHEHLPPGQMVDVGGFRLHALVRGEGTPAILLEPALGGFAQQYTHLQAGLSACTRVLAYDRAGQGWSDAGSQPRTPDTLAGDLHTLLTRLNIQPPYILAGHSFGGMLVRIYTALHPQDIAGVVLIDATHVDEYSIYPDIDRFSRQAASGVRLLKFASRIGLGKQVARLSLGSAARTLSQADLDTFTRILSKPKHHETMLAEFSQHRCYFGPHTQVPSTLGDIPLLVITAGSSISGRGKIAGVPLEQINALHQKLQKDLLNLSSRSRQVIIPAATHLSLLTSPEQAVQVVDAIRGMFELIRQDRG